MSMEPNELREKVHKILEEYAEFGYFSSPIAKIMVLIDEAEEEEGRAVAESIRKSLSESEPLTDEGFFRCEDYIESVLSARYSSKHNRE